MERVSFESVVTTVCEVYGYKLADIYQKAYKEGGLTQDQIGVLFEDYQERLYNRMVFEASLQGVNLNEATGKKPEGKVKTKAVPEFQSPEEYKNMSKEEREELTRQMMGKHKLKFG